MSEVRHDYRVHKRKAHHTGPPWVGCEREGLEINWKAFSSQAEMKAGDKW